MLTKIKIVALLTLSVLLLTNYAYASGNINLFLGQKNLEKSDWEPLNEQKEFGLELDMGNISSPVNFAIAYFRSIDDGTYFDHDFGLGEIEIECVTTEICLGVKKILDSPSDIHPFFAGGLAFIKGEVEARAIDEKVSDSDSNIGLWVSAGFYFTVNKTINLGAGIRYSSAKVRLADENIEIGGIHYGGIIGVHF